MSFSLGDTVELHIDHFGYGGVGVGKLPTGLVCFVHKALPGEHISGRIVRLKKRYATVALLDIFQASTKRIEPICRYFSSCGGCQLQHLSYPDQLQMKRDLLIETLATLNIDQVIEPVVAAEDPLNYRQKNYLHIHDKQVGFINPLTEDLVDIENCVCAPDETNQLISACRQLLGNKNLAAINSLTDIMIRQSNMNKKCMLILVVDEKKKNIWLEAFAPGGAKNNLHSAIETLPAYSVYVTFKTIESKKSLGDAFLHVAGEKQLQEEIASSMVNVSPSSFIQIYIKQANVLYKKTLEMIHQSPDQKVLELYSGAGYLTLQIAKQVESVYAVEQNHEAVLDAQAAAKHNQVHNVVFRSGKCETIVKRLKKEGQQFTTAVMNPPRKGCDIALLNQLKGLGIERIVYISCSPPTLKRDLETLRDQGFQVRRMVPVDMFPQTYHLETVSLLTRQV